MRLYLYLIVLESSSTNTPFTAEDFIKKLVPNVWSFVIQILALIVLFIAIFFIAYKPVKKYVDKRHEYVEHNLHDAEDAKREAIKREEESRVALSESKKAANAVIEQAKLDAEKAGAAVLAEADQNALKRQQEADEAIKQAELKSQARMKEEIVNLALDASKAVLGREVKSADNERLVAYFVDSVQTEKKDS